MRSLALALVVAILGPPQVASAAPRVHLEVENVNAADGLPPELPAKAALVLSGVLGEHTELAPAAGKGITSYALTSNVNLFERTVEPNPNGNGQVLVVKVGVQLVGSVLPSRAMALTGSGRSTVKGEVGATVNPREVGTGRFSIVARLRRESSDSSTRIGIWRSESENFAAF